MTSADGTPDSTDGTDLVVGADGLARCAWAASATRSTRATGDAAAYLAYHDDEWGRPVHGDGALYERLVLEAFQSGLSWLTILRKRAAFRRAFAGFDPDAVAAFGPADEARLLTDAGIVRHRAKVSAAIANARAVVALRAAEGDGALDRLVWSYAPPPGSRPAPRRLVDVPGMTLESAALARALKARGVVFVGPTTAYATMQACGLVDDHLAGCHRRRSVSAP